MARAAQGAPVAPILPIARPARLEPRPTMVSTEVAVALNYVRRKDGKADRKKVYRLAKEGLIPGPINDALPVVDWRWSRAVIERYCAGGES